MLLFAKSSRMWLSASPNILRKRSTSQILALLNASQTRKLNTTPNLNTKALTVWEDLRELKRSPVPALTLGLAGLIPFAAAPTLMAQQGVFMPEIAHAQLAYGATILSFLGGVRWGFLVPPEGEITPTWLQYSWSVTPSLIAWVGLLMPTTPGLVTCMGGLGVAGYLDLIQYGYPSWFKGLRFVLTTVALLSLWSTLMCKMIMSEGPKEDR